MSQISTCPRCRLQVSLPAKVSPASQVKCPLCSAEYTLQEALDQVPPMLIVLTAVGAALDAGSTGLLPEVEFPDAEGEGMAHFADDDGIVDHGSDGVDEDDAEGRLALGDEAPDESGAMIGGPLRRDEDDGAFDLDRRAGGSSRTASDRRGGGGFGEMIKAVLGAVIGLAIGYYILLWLGRDPAQLKPFLHDYLPDWLVP